jgi:cytochrome c
MKMAPKTKEEGDSNKGEKIFKSLCSNCHSMSKHGTGPSLKGTYGAAIGAKEGFNYSSAMKANSKKWSDATLDKYLKSPADFIPRNAMAFAGITNVDDRKDLIAYLRHNSLLLIYLKGQATYLTPVDDSLSKLQDSDGNIVYEGSIGNSAVNGFGTVYNPQGQRTYAGAWKEGRPHGQGVVYDAQTQNKRYEGSFEQSMYHGYGVSFHESTWKRRYKGFFKSGLRSGDGKAYN